MPAKINEDELQILAWLHEHATGYGQRHQFLLSDVGQGVGIDKDLLPKPLSYLEEHGLVGVHAIDVSTQVGDEYVLEGVWLTGIGEDYMRELEAQPGIARKLTVGAVRELWGMGKGILVSEAPAILANFARHFHA